VPLTYTETVAAAVTPISVSDCKEHSHIDGNDDNAVLERMIDAATEYLQGRTNRQFANATFALYLDEFPSTCIRLPRTPLSTVTSITYTDSAGATQTWNSSTYDTDAVSEPGRITPSYGESFPANRAGQNTIVVTFVAGYGATAASVPARLRSALLMVVADLYENREAQTASAFTFKPNPTVDAIVDQFRIVEAR